MSRLRRHAVGGIGAALGGLIPELLGFGERFTMVTYLGWFAWLGVGALRRSTPRD
jgi:hypothetical protein